MLALPSQAFSDSNSLMLDAHALQVTESVNLLLALSARSLFFYIF